MQLSCQFTKRFAFQVQHLVGPWNSFFSPSFFAETRIGYSKKHLSTMEKKVRCDLRATTFLPWSVCSFHQEICHWSDEEWVFFVLNNHCPGHHLNIQPDQLHHPREEESCANAYCSRLMSDHRNIERMGQSEKVLDQAVALDGQTVFRVNKVFMLV